MNVPLVMMALVAAGTLNCIGTRQRNETVTMTLCLLHILRETRELTSSAANLSTAVKGVFSGTLRLRVGMIKQHSRSQTTHSEALVYEEKNNLHFEG